MCTVLLDSSKSLLSRESRAMGIKRVKDLSTYHVQMMGWYKVKMGKGNRYEVNGKEGPMKREWLRNDRRGRLRSWMAAAEQWDSAVYS